MHEPGRSPHRGSRPRSAGYVRIAISDPHDVVRAGLRQLISSPAAGRYCVVDQSSQGPPDAVLYSVDGDHSQGLHDPVLHALVRRTPAIVIATFWDDTSPAVRSALACGAHGALSKRLPRGELLEGIQRVIDGRTPEVGRPADDSCREGVEQAGLTRRELDVLGLVAGGLTNQEIADRLYLTINSVKTYVRGAYRKIGATRRAQAVIWAERHGVTSPGHAVVNSLADADDDDPGPAGRLSDGNGSHSPRGGWEPTPTVPRPSLGAPNGRSRERT